MPRAEVKPRSTLAAISRAHVISTCSDNYNNKKEYDKYNSDSSHDRNNRNNNNNTFFLILSNNKL
jgi:hypothetical protein